MSYVISVLPVPGPPIINALRLSHVILLFLDSCEELNMYSWFKNFSVSLNGDTKNCSGEKIDWRLASLS